MPVECFPLVSHRVLWHYLFRKPILLNSVTVDDRCEIVELELRRTHGRLPGFSLVKFSVSQQSVHSVALPVGLSSQCHSDSSGEAYPQRAAWKLDAWNSQVWVALKSAVKLSKSL